jgi:serine/threonine-protein kinase
MLGTRFRRAVGGKSPAPEVGETFEGKYRIEKVLGRGGMGIVIGARHLRLDEPVAIKLLWPELLDEPGLIARFQREARAAAKIKSEYVARVLDIDVTPEGMPYIVMEQLEGQDLGAVCRQEGALSVARAARYVIEACHALSEAHALGIIHRDLKPANLFLARRRDGSTCVKVLDFGISKLSGALSGADGEMTRTTTALGSPYYMSPEQMLSARQVDARTDLWSLGVTLYRLLTGRLPFVAESTPELIALVLQAPPTPPRQLRPSLPEALEAVVLRCLEKSPARRYGNAAELAAALAPFAAANRGDSMAGAAPAPRRATPASREGIRARARPYAGWIAAITAVIATMTAGVVAVWAARGVPPPPAAPARKAGIHVGALRVPRAAPVSLSDPAAAPDEGGVQRPHSPDEGEVEPPPASMASSPPPAVRAIQPAPAPGQIQEAPDTAPSASGVPNAAPATPSAAPPAQLPARVREEML